MGKYSSPPEMKLELYDTLKLEQFIRRREGEVRLGEKVQTIAWKNSEHWGQTLREMPGAFVLLGLPEDVGVRANFGRGGAYSAWLPALTTLLNTQSNETLSGEELIVLGHLDFSPAMEEMKPLDLQMAGDLKRARELVAEMDRAVYPVMEAIFAAGKEAIIIGGGHNNAYANLKGLSMALAQKGQTEIGCINCDAHSDLRPMEGRHSGNAFSYALHEGFLHRYAMVGLHENYNAAGVMEKMETDERLMAIWFEDIFIRENCTFREAVDRALNFTAHLPLGIELDLDCIQNIPSSAKTSSGISTVQARQFVHWVASSAEVKYLHLAEAAPVLSHIKTDLKTGKLIAYLISDYIKARNSRLK